MRADIENLVTSVEKSLELLRQRMDWDTVSHRLEEFDARVENPNLWDNPEEAQKLMRERQTLLDAMEGHNQIRDDLSYNIEMIALGEEEEDSEIIIEAEKAISLLAKTAASKELEALLNGEADANDTFLEIHAGAGGTESCDWAAMLARMYLRWAQKTGYNIDLQAETPGEEPVLSL